MILTPAERTMLAEAVAYKITAQEQQRQGALLRDVDNMIKGAMAKVNKTLEDIKAEQGMMRKVLEDVSGWMIQLMQHNGLMTGGYEAHHNEVWTGEMEVEAVEQPPGRVPPRPRQRQEEVQGGGPKKKVILEQEEILRRQARQVALEAEVIAAASPALKTGRRETEALMEKFKELVEANGMTLGQLAQQTESGGWQ
jgi:hypothetical protein